MFMVDSFLCRQTLVRRRSNQSWHWTGLTPDGGAERTGIFCSASVFDVHAGPEDSVPGLSLGRRVSVPLLIGSEGDRGSVH
jgi:hypothetical protein